MALTSSDISPRVASRDVHFYMLDGVKPVECLVAGEALRDAVPNGWGDGPGWTAQLLGLFHALRPRVEAAAASKFASGAVKPDGTVVVLTRDLAA
jgi:hypothetical protein